MRILYHKSKKYYLYNSYDTMDEAMEAAHYFKKKTKSRYYIIKAEVGFMFPKVKYLLYLTNVIAL